MISAPLPSDTGGERKDLHNASIDEPAAAAGRCGTIHLPTGRTCRAQAHHADSCDFGPASMVPTSTVRSREAHSLHRPAAAVEGSVAAHGTAP